MMPFRVFEDTLCKFSTPDKHLLCMTASTIRCVVKPHKFAFPDRILTSEIKVSLSIFDLIQCLLLGAAVQAQKSCSPHISRHMRGPQSMLLMVVSVDVAVSDENPTVRLRHIGYSE